MWKSLLAPLKGVEPDTYIRVFSETSPTLENLNELEERMVRLVGDGYEIESENRIQEKVSNDDLRKGVTIILGGFCALLAVIGIANVFSNTLGFIRQRKREFAQYMSIGLTPAEMKKMFCIEAMVFWVEAPIIPILIFAATIIVFVALAYYIGGKRILQCDLNETLRNDMVV